jgi:hypothetical protein
MLRKRDVVSVIWLLALRDADSAARFAAVYRKVLDHMHGRPAAHRVEVKGNAVLIVIGEPAAHFDALAPAVWKASSITPAPPPMTPGAPSLHAATPPVRCAPPGRLAAAR